MKTLVRILITLCALVTAAHFLRFGTVWDALPALILVPAAWLPGLAPRPLMILAAAAGTVLWAMQTHSLVSWRQSFGMPWLRLAAILVAVTMAHLATLVLLLGDAGRRAFGPVRARDTAATAAALLIGVILVLARSKTPFPLLLGERFLPGSGPVWVCAFALYGAHLTSWMLDGPTAAIRARIWTLFSAAFFGQLLLGLAGWEKFLMTGSLHLPVPALIVSGPLFRGEGFFMPILLAVSLLLTGPAWCSHLCYIGAWDDRLSRLHSGRPEALPARAPRLRAALLAAAVAVPLALRAAGVSWTWGLSLAALFGLAGVGVMIAASRRSGTMVHCTVWCPIGLLNNLAGRILPWRVTIDSSCTGCGLCSQACRYNALTRADLDARRPGLTCSLCGDCMPRCPHGHIGYAFPGLDRVRARQVFITLVASLHAVFLAVARI